MARMPGVKFVGPSPNISENGLDRNRVRGVVIHIAEGYWNGTQSWQMNPSANVSSHFIVDKDGAKVQMVDTDDAAWTQRDGNDEWLSIEFIGFAGQSLTPEQIESGAEILLWAHRTFPDVPLQVASRPSGRGLGHHSMGAEHGVNWGHSQCPGVPIKAQKPAIVAMAVLMNATGGSTMAGEKADDFAQAAKDGTPEKVSSPFWAINALREILTHVRALRGGVGEGTPDNTTLTLTPAQVEELGKSTARNLLDLVAKK